MQVGTYPTRNFATLGPLWLQPPFTGVYISNFFNLKISPYSTGQVSDPLLHFTILQSPVFLINSRYPLFCFVFIWFLIIWHSFSRSYRVILPSSFNIIFSIHLHILYLFTGVGFQYGFFVSGFFSNKFLYIMKNDYI